MDNPFWEYSLDVYRREDVARHCLALQDRFGADVNLLLYAAWLACLGQRLQEAHLREVGRLVAAWREEVVKPLRTLRRQLAGNGAAADIREDIKALELRAERRQQDMLYEHFQEKCQRGHGHAATRPPEPGVLLGNVALATRHSSGRDSGWEESVAQLVRALLL